MTDTTTARTSGWKAFWNRGGWWKAFGLAVVYLAVYQLLPFTALPFTQGVVDPRDVFATPGSVFVALALPVVLGSVVLLAFAWSIGWLPKPLFARQPVTGRWWMWIAPVVVAIPILLRLFGIDYGAYSAGVIAMTFVAGAFIGLSEELLTRGLAVTLLRRCGYNEWVVAALSTLIFAVLHSVNLFTGQSIATVGFTLLYTFAFGILMYLTLRVTGNLIWPIILHALTDPTTFLASGGIDETNAASQNPLLALAGPATFLLIAAGFVLLIFIRGNAHGHASAEEAERDSQPTTA
ncbi:CPBP family intramembrane glutamic endopeptidase [Agromyces mariniharenae]|uniref:CPBP family intramembrane metalloprotease n=1 Tax=Agromyces mariniharenae TaxID=2604423 RepID=A0A5S4VFW1_9MICO|nr:CPBP family intramembrane glutamic endopeptidase [Agromyces mariniharenae]TYL52935.1 CPBP family intramembrane metalloprotease [Agromyces mariniharenae]